jgi:hypothetical protein
MGAPACVFYLSNGDISKLQPIFKGHGAKFGFSSSLATYLSGVWLGGI